MKKSHTLQIFKKVIWKESLQYAHQPNGIAERAVQTVKKDWKPDLRASFQSFLQRILLTHKNRSSAHRNTPARLIFGNFLMLPALVDFEMGQPLFYRAIALMLDFTPLYLVRKGTSNCGLQPKEESPNKPLSLYTDIIKKLPTNYSYRPLSQLTCRNMFQKSYNDILVLKI